MAIWLVARCARACPVQSAAGLVVVWPRFVALAVIGAVLFVYALARFRSTIGAMA